MGTTLNTREVEDARLLESLENRDEAVFSEEMWEAMRLRLLERLPYRRIGERMNKSGAASQQLVMRGRNKLAVMYPSGLDKDILTTVADTVSRRLGMLDQVRQVGGSLDSEEEVRLQRALAVVQKLLER
jgi:predicted DNA-binding protein (UPF0251 family)